eukprot:Unigene224_Nuclearia_a/m.823 Unigene224_Nuclearia_a/g.823  ORF Unigene224_Nuclearia_a/g.823 Unigene224_Nuclearia_a/m.823 type:complete len:457 (-) Unigene224_Nuclearia_a:18-1388(-)
MVTVIIVCTCLLPTRRPSPENLSSRRPLRPLLAHVLRGMAALPKRLLLKFSGDGRRVGSKHVHTMITVTIVTGGDADRTPDRHWPLALLACGEEYENVSRAFTYIAPEIEDLKSNGLPEFGILPTDICTLWTSDWKFMNCVLGLKAANADECCPWCTSKKVERQDVGRLWTTRNTALATERQLVQVDFTLVDVLHLLLRVGDQLLKGLVREIIEHQHGLCGKCAHRSTCAKRLCSCECHASKLRALSDAASDLGVTLEFFAARTESTGADSGSVGWSSLRGPDKYLLIKKLDLAKALPGPRAAAVRSLWNKFLHVLDTANVRRVLCEEEIVNLECAARDFLRDYAKAPVGMEDKPGHAASALGGTAQITPYLHALSAHLGDHLRVCARLGFPLANLSTEPVEKKNHEHVRFFFHHTTQGGGTRMSAILQTMQKENRLLYRPPPRRTMRTHRVKIKK